jgi:hypothetical protein
MSCSLRDQRKFLVSTFYIALFSTYIALITIICGCTSYYGAARTGKVSTIQKYLDRGGDINARDENGWTALSLAAYYGHSEVVKLLIDKGADIHARDNEGRTALIHAARSRFSHVAIVKLLIDKGADIHARDNEGRTALIHAARCSFSHVAIVKLLIDKGADIHAMDNNGCTALMLSTQVTHSSTFQLLLNRNAVVDIPPGCGVLVCFGEMRVTECDGEALPKNATSFACEEDISSRFITLPAGHHNINVEFERRFRRGAPISLTFDVRSGHIYGIEYQINEQVGKWNAWVKMYK